MPVARVRMKLADDRYASVIGHICVTWNYLEDMAAYVTTRYFGYDQELTFAVVGLLGNQSRIDLLAHLVKEREADEAVAECLLHFCRAYNTCRENRNILVHSSVRLKEPLQIEGLEKRSKTSIGKVVKYGYDIAKLEEVQEEMGTLLAFVSILLTTIVLNRLKPTDPPRPLPHAPPLPSKLIPLPPEGPRDGPPQPLS